MKLQVCLLVFCLLADFVPSETLVPNPLSIITKDIKGMSDAQGAGNGIYFVTPSRDIPCCDKFQDDNPCLTLSQYARKPSSYFNKIQSIFFIEPGDHHLTRTFSLRNMNIVYMVAVDLDATTVTCKKSANFQFHKISNQIGVEGLKLFNCGGNTISFVNSLQWGYSSFQGEGGNGTALDIMDTNRVQIYSSQFVSNTGKKILQDGLNEALAGGAIIANNTNLYISDCVFYDNNANMGGAIYALNVTIETYNVTFVNNQANKLDNIFGCMGGAMYVNQPFSILGHSTTGVSITANIFTGNLAVGESWCQGGGIYIYTLNTVAITHSVFTNNSADMEGGGAFIKAGITKISFSDFSYNQAASSNPNLYNAGHGGALYYSTRKAALEYHLTIDSCNFSYNRGSGLGGAYGSFPDYDYKFTIINSTFHSNTAEESGGAIFSYRNWASINITASTFTRNSAKRVATAIYVDGQLNLTNATFVGNTGDPMATSMIEMVDPCLLRSTGFLKIQENTANFVISITKGSAIFSGHTLISNNTGSVYIASGNIIFDGHTEFVNNTFVPSTDNETTVAAAITCIGGGVTLKGNTTFLYNNGMYAGPIYATQANILISGDITIANQMDSAALCNSHKEDSKSDEKKMTEKDNKKNTKE